MIEHHPHSPKTWVENLLADIDRLCTFQGTAIFATVSSIASAETFTSTASSRRV